MPHDNLFRFVLLSGAALIFPIALYHRLKSQASKEKLDRRQEGLFIYLTLRPIAAIGMLGMITFLIRPSSMAWSSIPLPLWLRWVGVGLGVLAAALAIAVYRNLGTNLTDTVVTRARHTLVTSGPYRWVRHPFYLAFGLAVVANSLTTANWFLGLTGAITVSLLVVRTATEERKLVERFGEEYQRYMKRTGRFFPYWSR